MYWLYLDPFPAERIRKLGYLDAIAFYCENFGLAFDPFRHEWPVVNLAFNPCPDPLQLPEVSKQCLIIWIQFNNLHLAHQPSCESFKTVVVLTNGICRVTPSRRLLSVFHIS